MLEFICVASNAYKPDKERLLYFLIWKHDKTT